MVKIFQLPDYQYLQYAMYYKHMCRTYIYSMLVLQAHV